MHSLDCISLVLFFLIFLHLFNEQQHKEHIKGTFVGLFKLCVCVCMYVLYVCNGNLFGNVKLNGIYYFSTCIEHRGRHFYVGMIVGISTVISNFLNDINLT